MPQFYFPRVDPAVTQVVPRVHAALKRQDHNGIVYATLCDAFMRHRKGRWPWDHRVADVQEMTEAQFYDNPCSYCAPAYAALV